MYLLGGCHLNLDLLQTFLSLAETKNFRKTAEFLYISQSAVTMRIKNLEKELGHTLFLRDNKNVELSPAGQHYLGYATQMYQLLKDSNITMQNFNRYRQHIFFSTTSIVWENKSFLSGITNFVKNNPHIYLKLNRDLSDNIIQDLTQGSLDICITHYYPHNPDIENRPFISEELVLVANPDINNLICDHKNINSKNIDDAISLIHMDYGPSITDDLLRSLPYSTSRIETNYIPALILMLENGLGVGLIVKYMIEEKLETGALQLVDCDYNKNPIRYNSYILYNKKKKHHLAKLIDCLLKYIQ